MPSNDSYSHAGPSKPTLVHPLVTRIPQVNGPLSAPPSAPYFSHPHTLEEDEDVLDVIPTRVGRKLCVRHKQMANQNVSQKLQKSLDNLPTSERSAITHLWSTFSNAPHSKRKIILEGVLTMCCFSQLSHLSDSLNQIIRIDPFSLLPREVNFRILGNLDAITLGRAACVSKSWKALADDDLLWRRMCGQHIDRKCEKCGWGLPALERKRLKVELKDGSPSAAVGVGAHVHGEGGKHQLSRVTRVEALGGKSDIKMKLASLVCDPVTPNASTVLKRSAPDPITTTSLTKKAKAEGSDTESEGASSRSEAEGSSREVRLTRPWKTVYCERLAVERNWRKGRCVTKSLKGHTDGVMCLQYHDALTNPSYPVLITGSYDKSVRVWNLESGTLIRTLVGHTRAIRALQFDQMLLFTGAMDGTVRMWNWRAGECLRVLDGHTDGVVALNYNGYLLATGSADKTIQVWNFRTGNKFVLRGHEEWVNSVVLWDGKSSPSEIDPTKPPSFTTEPSSRCRSTAMPTLPISHALADADNISALSESKPKRPEIDPGTMLFSASDDQTIKLWDLTSQTCIRTFEGHKAQIQSLKVIMVNLSDEELRLSKRRANTPPAQTGFVPASQAVITPSPPGASLVEFPEGFDPIAHRRKSGDEIRAEVLVHMTVGEGKAKESEDVVEKKRPLLVSGSLDGTVKLWDVETGTERSTLFGHIEGVWSVDIDALRLASASHDRTIKVWDRESGTCVQTLVGHRGAVTSLQLSDDMIVSGSDDGDVMVWNFGPGAGQQSVKPIVTVAKG